MKRLKKHTANTITVDQFDDAVYNIIDNIEDAKNSLTKLKNDDVDSDARMSQEDLKKILLETKLKLNQALDELRKSLYRSANAKLNKCTADATGMTQEEMDEKVRNIIEDIDAILMVSDLPTLKSDYALMDKRLPKNELSEILRNVSIYLNKAIDELRKTFKRG